MIQIHHGRVTLALHELARRDGPSLLLLHALFGSSDDWGEAAAAWPGSVFALDFSGHGRSAHIAGGAYCPELLLGDADSALAHIGRAAIAGAGVGAYVALLLAGARPDAVPTALLLPGQGLAGGGALPDFNREFPLSEWLATAAGQSNGCDPMVRALESDVRPLDYVEPFARAARAVLVLDDGTPHPPWWNAVRRSPGTEVVHGSVAAALARLAQRVAVSSASSPK